MIVEFKIKNFRSYKEETTFTFEALDENFKNENYTIVELENKERIKLLKSAISAVIEYFFLIKMFWRASSAG